MSPRRAKPRSRPTRATAAAADRQLPQSPASLSSSIDYRGLFERAPDAIFVVDGEGRYIEANAAACKLTGYTRDELLKKKVGDLAVPEERSLSAERFDLLRKTGETRRGRTLQRKDGTRVTVEAHAVALGNGTYQTIVRDISEQVAARAELQRSLEAYSTLIELCHAAVISAGRDGRITSWNRAAEALFGYSPKEATGLPITGLISPRLRKRHQAAFDLHTETARTIPFTRTINTEGIHKDGTEIPIELSLAVGRRDGNLIFTAVIRDVSEQRIIVEKLNDALQRLQFHVERMPLAYIVWDTDFVVVEWNPAAERMFGHTKAEALGRHAYDLVVPPDAVPAVDVIWADLLHGDTSSHSINANVRKDGTRLTCEWFNTPLRDSAGKIRGVASMAMDVTEREATEARLRNSQKLESLGVMAGGIAHDFNSSLMVMLGNASLLRSVKGLPPRAQEHLQLIEDAGARADDLIKHLLSYARTGRHQPQPTDLSAVVREAMTFIRSPIGKEHELDLQLADDLPTILADRGQIEQILLNLCLNAKQAMQKGGTIAIITRTRDLTAIDAARCVPYDAKPGRYVELAVSDTGIGMDQVTVSRIFDPFFTTKTEGHGLGMAAVLGILRQHSATAMIDSSPGKGARIHVFFPIAKGTAKDDDEAPQRNVRANGNRIARRNARRRRT